MASSLFVILFIIINISLSPPSCPRRPSTSTQPTPLPLPPSSIPSVLSPHPILIPSSSPHPHPLHTPAVVSGVCVGGGVSALYVVCWGLSDRHTAHRSDRTLPLIELLGHPSSPLSVLFSIASFLSECYLFQSFSIPAIYFLYTYILFLYVYTFNRIIFIFQLFGEK